MPKGNHQPRIPCDEALEHIERLLTRYPYVTKTHFAKVAGVTCTVITKMEPGVLRSPTSIARILAVRDEHIRLFPPKNVPAGPTVAHIKRLLRLDGVVPLTIAKASGLSHQGVYNLLNRPRTLVDRSTHVAILSLTPENVLDSVQMVPRAPYVTKVRALQANQWPLVALSAMGGFDADHVVGDHATLITATKARLIDDLYRRLGDQPGPDPRSATWARNGGHYPPMYYDDDMRLIVEALPNGDDDAEAERQTRGRRALVTLGLTLRGKFPREIAAILGIEADGVGAYRERCGLRTVKNASEFRVVIAPCQEPLLAAITARLEGIDLSAYDASDRPGIDYYARYKELRTGTWMGPQRAPQGYETEEAAAA